jgi:hypothetical protein
MRGMPRLTVLVALLLLSSCGGGGPTPPTTLPPTPQSGSVTACIRPLADGGVVKVGQSATFDGGCSTPASGLTYTWDFGDGRPVKTGGPTMTDSYARSGRFTLSLTVSSGGTNSNPPATAPVRVHIECLQPASNGSNVISVDQNRACLISGDAGVNLQVTSNGTVLFKGSDFRLEGTAFEVPTNECLDKALSGSTLFPGQLCNIRVRGTCSEGTTGRFSIGGPGGDVPTRYNINLTCNP